MDIVLGFADYITAFGSDARGIKTPVIGTKIIDRSMFVSLVAQRIKAHDKSKDRESGQHFIVMPELLGCVTGGVGTRSLEPADYVLRAYRGKVRAFLKREKAETLTDKSFLAVVVFSVEAYLRDPDVRRDEEEAARIQKSNFTHVLVAIIAGSNYMSPDTAIHNIAGGNNEWNKMTLEDIRTKAKWVEEVDNLLCTVAD